MGNEVLKKIKQMNFMVDDMVGLFIREVIALPISRLLINAKQKYKASEYA